jgi:hypothetical protein
LKLDDTQNFAREQDREGQVAAYTPPDSLYHLQIGDIVS